MNSSGSGFIKGMKGNEEEGLVA